MAGFDIDFGALQQPNPLGSFLGGVQARQQQQNTLADQRYRQERIGMEREKFALDKQTATTEAETARRKERAEVLLRATKGLMSVPSGQRKAALDSATPMFQAAGIDTSVFANLTEDQLSDQGLRAFGGEVAKSLQIVNRGEGGYDVVDTRTGDAVRSVAPRLKPQQFGDYLYIPEGAASAAPSAPMGGSSAAPANTDETWGRMIQRESGGRPGVTGPPTPYGRAQGMTQMLPATAQQMAQKLGVPWRPELMTGTTPEAADYQQKLGRAYYEEGLQKYGGDPAKAASYYHGGPDERLWGPKTRAYAEAVTGGVSGSAGVSAPPGMAGGQGGDTLGGVPEIPGYRAVGRVKGAGEWVSDGQGNLINSKTKDRKIDPTATVGADSSLVDQKIVKGLIEGRITPPSGFASTKPYWQAQLAAAVAQDPTFDSVNFNARAKARADFTSGKSAVNITALNTVVGHLDSLDKAIDNLGNAGPGGVLNLGPLNKWNNQAANTLAHLSGTDSRLRDFETKKEAVANELTRVFRGTGGAEADIQAWKAQLNSAGSPEALHGVVRAMAELINSRLEALGEQYQQGMGTTKDPLTLLTPDKQRAFRRLQGEEAPPAPQRHPPSPPAGPKPGVVIKGYRFKGGDPSQQSSWVRVN